MKLKKILLLVAGSIFFNQNALSRELSFVAAGLSTGSSRMASNDSELSDRGEPPKSLDLGLGYGNALSPESTLSWVVSGIYKTFSKKYESHKWVRSGWLLTGGVRKMYQTEFWASPFAMIQLGPEGKKEEDRSQNRSSLGAVMLGELGVRTSLGDSAFFDVSIPLLDAVLYEREEVSEKGREKKDRYTTHSFRIRNTGSFSSLKLSAGLLF